MSEYPHTPGHKADGTSAAAATSMISAAPLLRQLVLAEVARQGGVTADECASALGLPVLSIRPRFSELAKEGRIVETGERRKNISGRSANVWRAA